MEFFDRLEMVLRGLRTSLAKRLRIRKSGLMKLRQEIRTCEYEDVRVMWEMLRNGNTACGGRCSPSPTPQRRGSRRAWSVFTLAARMPRRVCSSY